MANVQRCDEAGVPTIAAQVGFDRPFLDFFAHVDVAVEPVDMTCQIAFIDGGPGIPSGIRDKIFTPFFTTKIARIRSGLPTVKGLIEAHDGQIAIDCPAAGGTMVVIRLPMSTS
jgi:signal transduction histidine kinase